MSARRPKHGRVSQAEFDVLRDSLFTHVRPRFGEESEIYRAIELTTVGVVARIGEFTYQVIEHAPGDRLVAGSELASQNNIADAGHRPVERGAHLLEEMRTGARQILGHHAGRETMVAVSVPDEVTPQLWSAERHMARARLLQTSTSHRLEAHAHLELASDNEGAAACEAHRALADEAIRAGDHRRAGDHLAPLADVCGQWSDLAVAVACRQLMADFSTYRVIFERARVAATGTVRADVYSALLGRAYVTANACAIGLPFLESGLTSTDATARQHALLGIEAIVVTAERWSERGQSSDREIELVEHVYRRNAHDPDLAELVGRTRELRARQTQARHVAELERARSLCASPWEPDQAALVAVLSALSQASTAMNRAVVEMAIDPSLALARTADPATFRGRILEIAAAAVDPETARGYRAELAEFLGSGGDAVTPARDRSIHDSLADLRGEAAAFQLPSYEQGPRAMPRRS